MAELSGPVLNVSSDSHSMENIIWRLVFKKALTFSLAEFGHHKLLFTNVNFKSWLVVYFDQRLGAEHSKCWSKTPFSIFIARVGKVLLQKLRKMWQKEWNYSIKRVLDNRFYVNSVAE